MDIILKYWPIVLLAGGVLFGASAIILERRIKKSIRPKFNGLVTMEECRRTHEGIEGLVREMTQMVKDSLDTGERRLDRMEVMIRTQGKDANQRFDDFSSKIAGRFDTFEAVSLSRYNSLRRDVDESISKIDKELRLHIATNGRKP